MVVVYFLAYNNVLAQKIMIFYFLTWNMIVLEGMLLHGLHLIYRIDANMLQFMGLTDNIECVVRCPQRISACANALLHLLN